MKGKSKASLRAATATAATVAVGAALLAAGPAAAALPGIDPGPIVKDTNFIPSGQVKFGKDQVGLLGAEFPNSIYNGSLFTSGQVYNSPDCSKDWMFDQILCDPGEYLSNPFRLGRLNQNAGLTLYNDPQGNKGFVIIDLKQARQFNTLRVFQMFSDGKVTDVALAAGSGFGDNWPAWFDAGWTEVVPRSPVTPGENRGAYLTCPTVLSFAPTTARYVRLDLWNTTALGSPTYVEIAGAKLMYEDSAPTTEQSCPPAEPTNVKATYAGGKATVTWNPPAGVVTGQTVYQSSDGGVTWTKATTVPATLDGKAKTAEIAVGPGTYVFRVEAFNLAGESMFTGASQSNSITATKKKKKKQKPVKPLNLPKRVKATGWTTITKLPVRTNAGQRARVLLRATPRGAGTAGEQRFAVVSRADGKLQVRLFGKPARVRLSITAPPTDTHTAYRLKRVWTTS